MEKGTYSIYEGGNDIFSKDQGYLLITDTIRGDQWSAEVIDFHIDEMGNGCVYFDGEKVFSQANVPDYDSLERIFYLQYTVEQINN